MVSILKRFLSDDSGATTIEYSLLVAMVSVVGIGVMDAFGGALVTIFGLVEANLSSGAMG